MSGAVTTMDSASPPVQVIGCSNSSINSRVFTKLLDSNKANAIKGTISLLHELLFRQKSLTDTTFSVSLRKRLLSR